jgi:curved DNA-binding protein CbpA
MEDPKGYYKILGLLPNSSIDDVKNAYRKLAIIVHPDKISSIKGKEKAKEIFVKISEAYQILSDKTKKEDYDMYGSSSLFENFFKNHDEVFDYFDNIFKNHMRFFNSNIDDDFELFRPSRMMDDLKRFNKINNGQSKYKSIQKISKTNYIDGKRETFIKEIIDNNGLIEEKIIRIDDKGQKKENIKKIDNRKNKGVLKIDEKKHPNF